MGVHLTPNGTTAPNASHAESSPRWGRFVTAGVWLLLLLCVATSIGAASAWRSSVKDDAQQRFDATSSDVAALMTSALRRDTDFIATLRSTLASRPKMTNAELSRWIDGGEALTRYPGGVGFGFVAQVPAARLVAFQAEVQRDPSPIAEPSPLIPPGDREIYCLLRIAISDSPTRVPLGLDLCAAAIPGVVSESPGVGLRSAADTGEFTVQVLDATHGFFGINAPVYRDGTTPSTVTERRATLLGWALGSFDGAAILAGGGGVRDGMRVEIIHQNPGQQPALLAAAGTARSGGLVREFPVGADGAWVVRVSGTPTVQKLSADAQFWIVLAGGLVVSGLLFGFVEVLARSRRRALRLVERKTIELRHQAMHDGLTGLPNRVLILDRIENALARCRRSNGSIAVMFLDLDGFKGVNDTLGHAVGDQLLRSVSTRLVSTLRDSDTVGRLGGDEFVVLVDGEPLDVDRVAERIRATLAEPFHLGPDEELIVQTHASIGIATGIRASADELLSDADIALYQAKDGGKNRYVVFAPKMQSEQQRRLDMETDLRSALGSDQLSLTYEPRYDGQAGTVTRMAASVHWEHPTRGPVIADDFLSIAEDTALIVPIGRWALVEACREAVDWQRHDRRLPVSVVLCRRQLHAAEIVADVQAALERSGLEPSLLTLEIPETALTGDPVASLARLRALKALGVRIATDDSPALLPALVQLGEVLDIRTPTEDVKESADLVPSRPVS